MPLRVWLRQGRLYQPGGKGTLYFPVEEQEDIEEEEQEEVMPTVEGVEDIYQKVHKELAEELLEEIKSKKPKFLKIKL